MRKKTESVIMKNYRNIEMSACGVMCSGCGAYHAASKGPEYQQEVADAWRRIYERDEATANISCGGCLGPEREVFHTSIRCTARRCCRSKGFNSCAECPENSCDYLERAQSVWDGVPQIGSSLSPEDFKTYAQPYCGHRERLAAARRALNASHLP
jgi:hypothetical protein